MDDECTQSSEILLYKGMRYVAVGKGWYEQDTGRQPSAEVASALQASGKDGALDQGQEDVVRSAVGTQLLEVLGSKGIWRLYHFTDSRNIDSIRRCQGLYSWLACHRQNIDIPYPGGDGTSRALDQRDGHSDFVRLSFNPDHPMMYAAMKEGRIQTAVVLPVDVNVISWRGSLFCGQNATAAGAKVGRTVEQLKALPFEVILAKTHPDWELLKRHAQAEVLVKRWVPSSWIQFEQASTRKYYG